FEVSRITFGRNATRFVALSSDKSMPKCPKRLGTSDHASDVNPQGVHVGTAARTKAPFFRQLLIGFSEIARKPLDIPSVNLVRTEQHRVLDLFALTWRRRSK